MTFFAGQTISADDLYNLDVTGTYTPELTAVTTDPNLGANGTAVGWWHRNGRWIYGEARFVFSGAGLDPGSGVLLVSVPFEADASVQVASLSVAAGTHVGSGYISDASTAANRQGVFPYLRTFSPTQVSMRTLTNGNSVTHNLPFTWAEDDKISIHFAYLADPSAL